MLALLLCSCDGALHPSASHSRRQILSAAVSAPPLLVATTARGEVVDGLFADCGNDNNCVSSQDDRPQCWDPPWISEGDLGTAMARLRKVLTRFGGEAVQVDERYLRMRFASQGLLGRPITDVAEFYFTPNDTLVQFRAVRQEASNDFGENRKRLEKARIALGWEQVPVLRNRRRALVVVESPFDTFGPALTERDSMGFSPAELVPAESNRKELYGDLDPLAAPWRAPSAAMRESRKADLAGGVRDAWLRESDDRVRSK